MAASENIFNKDDIILINDITFRIIKLIGHGKAIKYWNGEEAIN